jgi:hypothetical protein
LALARGNLDHNHRAVVHSDLPTGQQALPAQPISRHPLFPELVPLFRDSISLEFHPRLDPDKSFDIDIFWD